jgi:hypothetical protein
MSRRQYPKHKDDPFDRFITERSKAGNGKFSMAKMVELFDALGCSEFIPNEGGHGTRRMTAGIQLRRHFADGVLRFRDGSTVTLSLEEP